MTQFKRFLQLRRAVFAAARRRPGCRHAADIDFGKAGEPVKLVVGYQPYYTESWSGVIMRSKKFYEKYLPKGSHGRVPDRPAGRDHRQQHARRQAAHRLLRRHAGHRVDDQAGRRRHPPGRRRSAWAGTSATRSWFAPTRRSSPTIRKRSNGWTARRVAVPKGSCTDRFAQAVFKQRGHPAVRVPEPEHRGDHQQLPRRQARRGGDVGADHLAPGAGGPRAQGRHRALRVNENDAGFLGMRADLIKQRPDVVKAWLNAELDAQLFFADPKNAMEVIKMAQEQTTGFSERALWMSALRHLSRRKAAARRRASSCPIRSRPKRRS